MIASNAGFEGIVDFHVHAFPESIASRALETLLTAYGVPAVTDGTIEGTLRHMELTGVACSVIQPVATKPTQVRSINDWAASISDPRIVSFAGIHPDCKDVQGEIDRIVELGLPGIKIQANWQGVAADDRRMYPIYEAAQGRLIVMFHSGQELAPFQDMLATPARLAVVHRDFPRLTMIAAHMGGYRMWDEAERHLIGTDIYLDTSACFPNDLDDRRFVEMIRRHGAERVLFATDLPFGNPADDIPRLLEIGLTDDELRLIFSENARRLLAGRARTEAGHDESPP